MKTIEEWFDTIKNKTARMRAKRNTPEAVLLQQTENIEDAFEVAFVWSESPEGHYYWIKIIDEL